MTREDGCIDGWVHGTLLVRQREAVRREIEQHKWYESERAGHDIGWDRAAVDWMIRFGCRTPREGEA